MSPLRHVHRGKVRDLYDVGDDRLLMVASDRLSAFDVVMAEPVPDKGRVLTAMSAFWFEQLRDVAPNHLRLDRRRGAPARGARRAAGRADDARAARARCCRSSASCAGTWRARRGRSTGPRAPSTASGCRPGCGRPTPCPRRCSRPRPRPPPAITTRTSGSTTSSSLLGGPRAEQARALSLAVYRAAAGHAEARGIVVADTKFELGLLDGELVLADEVLTPDSSRFWPVGGYEPGSTPPGVRQAARAGLARGHGLGQATAAAPAARRGGGRHPGPLRRDLRAALGPILRRLARLAILTPGGRGGRRCRATMAA